MNTNDIQELQQAVVEARTNANAMSDFRDRAQAEYDSAASRYDDLEENDPSYGDALYDVLKAEAAVKWFSEQSHQAWKVHGQAEEDLANRLD